ncbi:uncharacterized protein VP01_4837g1, partial [Puccinia sorghi]
TALHNTLKFSFPDSKTNLCAWHINKNITKNCNKHFPPGHSTDWEHFMKVWNSTMWCTIFIIMPKAHCKTIVIL